MAIIGVTHDREGRALERLPVTVKVAVALPPDEAKGRRYPDRMDHIVFKTRSATASTGWDVDAALTKKMVALYGQNPRELEIVFLSDNVDDVFRTELAWWSATRRECWGTVKEIDGAFAMQATRRTKEHPEGAPFPGNGGPCGETCRDLEEGRCNPSGDLYFIPFRFPSMGEAWAMHTKSWRSIRNIHNGLEQIRRLTGGRLAGLPLLLRVDPELVPHEDADGKRKRNVQQIWRIVFRAEDFERLLSEPAKHLALYEQVRKSLPARVVVEDDEHDRAVAIAPEFYPRRDGDDEEDEPAGRAAPGSPPAPSGEGPVRADIPADTAEVELRSKIHHECERLGMNAAAEHMILGQNRANLAALLDELTRQNGGGLGDLAPGREGGHEQTGKVIPAKTAQPAGAASGTPEAAPPPAARSRWSF